MNIDTGDITRSNGRCPFKMPKEGVFTTRLPTLVEREADYIRYVLERSGQNRTRAAKVLGIDRVSLWRKLKKYGMDEDK